MSSTLFTRSPFSSPSSARPAAARPASARPQPDPVGEGQVAGLVVAATDGSSLGNPGPAGWSWVVEDDGTSTGGCWAAGGASRETNNWGEITALIELLKAVPEDRPLEVRLDSALTLNIAQTWRHGWRKRGWKKADGGEVKNLPLVQELDRLLNKRSGSVVYRKVKAHKTDGSGDRLNEAADRRANAAATAVKRGLQVNSGPGWTE